MRCVDGEVRLVRGSEVWGGGEVWEAGCGKKVWCDLSQVRHFHKAAGCGLLVTRAAASASLYNHIDR